MFAGGGGSVTKVPPLPSFADGNGQRKGAAKFDLVDITGSVFDRQRPALIAFGRGCKLDIREINCVFAGPERDRAVRSCARSVITVA